MSGSRNNQFELEALEPRCLLSADLAAVAVAPGHASDGAAEVQKQFDLHTQSQGAIAYDAFAQVGSILPTESQAAVAASSGANPESGSTVTAATQSPSGTGQNSPANSTTSQVQSQQTTGVDSSASSTTGQQGTTISASSGVSQVLGNSTTQQLTSTLTAANGPPGSSVAQAPLLPGLQFMGNGVESLAGQVFYLDFVGASNLTYHGPVEVDGINIPGFDLSAKGLGGQESAVISRTVAALNTVFSSVGVTFTTTKPSASTEFSTIYVGGSGSEFAQYGAVWGVAEEVDAGNLNHHDNAFVFPDHLNLGTADDYAQALMGVIQHEAGHLLGYEHSSPQQANETGIFSVMDAGVTGLSFRSGSAVDAPIVDHVVLGQTVFMRVDAPGMAAGSTIDVQLVELPPLVGTAAAPVTKHFTINSQGYGVLELTFPLTAANGNPFLYATNSFQLHYNGGASTVASSNLSVTGGPSVVLQNPVGTVADALGLDYIDLTFDSPIDGSSLGGISFSGGSSQTPNITVRSVGFVDPNNLYVVRINLSAPLTVASSYTLKVGVGVKDVNGNFMDQDHNGIPGISPFDAYIDNLITLPEVTVQAAYPPGVTIVTHGYQLGGSLPEWTFNMADAVLDRAAGGTALGSAFTAAEITTEITAGNPVITPLAYGTELVYDPIYTDSVTGTHWRAPRASESTHVNTFVSNQEIVLIYDWAAISNKGVLTGSDGGAYIQSAADNLFAALLDPNLPYGLNGRSLTDYAFNSNTSTLNFHFIGHSRGAVVNALVVGEYDDEFGDGLKIDQVTSLDPHPAAGPFGSGIGDPWSTSISGLSTGSFPNDDHVLPTFTNVLFADDYYQDAGIFYEPLDGNFAGVPANGAFNVNLNSEVDGLLSPQYPVAFGGDHATIHLWYLGTILPNVYGISENAPADQLHPPLLGTLQIDSSVEADWYDRPGGAAATGFSFSLIGGSARPPANIMLGGVNGSGKINADSTYVPGNLAYMGSPLNPSFPDGSVFNGNLDSVGDTGTSVPGWYYPGSNVADGIVVGFAPIASRIDTTLGLEQTAPFASVTHNELFISPTVDALEFTVEADQAVANTNLTVWIDSIQLDNATIDLSGGNGSFIGNQVMGLPFGLTGAGHSLTFKIAGGQAGDVFIDNIKLVSVVVQNGQLTPAQRSDILQATTALTGEGQKLSVSPQATAELITSASPMGITLNSLLSNVPVDDFSDIASITSNVAAPALGNYFVFGDALNSYFAPGTTPNVNGIIEVLNGRASALVGSLGQGIGGNHPFSITGGYDSNGNLSFNVVFDLSKTHQVPIPLNQLLQGDGISADSTIMLSVTATLHLNFSFGVKANGTPFFKLNDPITVLVSDPETGLNGAIRIGSLAARIDQGTATLAAEFSATVAGGNEVTDFSNIPDPVVTTQTTAPLDVELPVTDSVGDFSQAISDGATISITESDVFSSSPAVVTVSPALKKVLPFANLNISDILAQITRFSDWLAQFRDSPLFDVKIPFTNGTTLGNAVDFATSFESKFYSEFVSLNLGAGSPSQSVQDTGQLTADTTFSLTIDTNAPVNITLHAADTQNNSSLGDLAQDFNTQFAATALNGKLQASVINGTLTFVLAPGQGTSLLLSSSSVTDPILTQVGFTDQQNGMDTPAFGNIQGFIAVLAQVMNSLAGPNFNISPHFDPTSQEITLQVVFTATPLNATTSFTVDPNLPLGNLLNVAAGGSLGITGSVTLGFTLGFSFQATSLPVLMSSLVVPAPSNGRLSGDAHFSLQLNTDVPFALVLTQQATGNNTTLDDLVSDLNALFGATLLPGSTTAHLSDEIQAYRPDALTNRIAIRPLAAELGVINAISISAADNDPMVTEAGFSNQQVAHAGATGLFIDNATTAGITSLLSGTLTLAASGLYADARLFNFIDVAASGGSANITASFTVGLTSRLYLSGLFGAIEAATGTPGITFGYSGSAAAALTTLQLKAPLLLTVPGGFSITIPDIKNLSAYDAATNPNGISVTYPNLGSLLDFNGYGFATILQALQIISSSLGQLSAFSFLNDPLPLIGKSVNDLISYADQFKTLINNLANNPAQTLQGFITNLNTQVDQTFGLSPGVLTISLDTTGANGSNGQAPMALKFVLNLSLASAKFLPFQLDLSQLVTQLGGTNPGLANILSAATSLVQADASGSLTANVGASLNLAFGLDLTAPNHIRPFFYDGLNGTGVTLTAKVTGAALTFKISLGSVLSVSINNGSAALSADGNPSSGPASISLTLSDPGNLGRLYFDAGWLSTSNVQLTMAGGVSATLPLFIAGLPLGGSGQTNGYPANDLILQIPDLIRFLTGSDTIKSSNHTATLLIPGVNNDLQISAATDFTVVLTDVGGDGISDSAIPTFSSGTLTIVINSGHTTAKTVKEAINTTLSGTFTASTRPGSDTGLGTVTTARVFVQTPDFSTLFSNIDFGDLLFSQTGILLDGLDKLLGSIEDGLNQLVLNTRLPLIGSGLTKAADFIQDFRSGLLAKLRADVAAAGGNGLTAVKIAIQKALWEALGPAGPLDILVDPNNSGALFSDQSAAGYSQLEVSLTTSAGLVVKLELKKVMSAVDTTSNPINLDIGVPGLGFTTQGNVIVQVGFDLPFGFGVSLKDGFYFDTTTLNIGFSVKIPGLHFTGSLAFLQLDIADDSAAPSAFIGGFTVTLKDPNGGARVTGAELTSGLPLSQFISGTLSATADLNLDLAASFGGDAAFPRIVAQFHLKWGFNRSDYPSTPTIWFDNVGLDLGSFISGFLGSILKEVQQITEPIQPILDMVTARIPIISDLAGETVNMLKLAEFFGYLSPSTVDFITDVAQVVRLINDIHVSSSGEIIIPFGAFNLSADSSGQLQEITPMSSTPDTVDLGATTSGSDLAQFANDLKSVHNFSIPIFDKPSLLFNLFVGKPVTLVQWKLPTFKFQFTYTQSFPIYPPLYVQFGGSVSAEIHLGIAYDTLGLQEFFSSSTKNAADLLDGFYIITNDDNGKPQPALTLTGIVFAGASLNLGVASGGVNGGLKATVNFFWNDNSDNDGKMRFKEIAADAAEGASCIFNIQGSVSVFLQAFVKVLSFHKTWDLGEFVLVDFSYTCPQPVLGSVTSGVLTLNIGTLAGAREVGDTSDGSESFVVRDAGSTNTGETIDVTFNNHMQQFTGVSSIFVESTGGGDNVVDCRGVKVRETVSGGTGNDTFYLSDGAGSIVYCGFGNDTVIASTAVGATGVTIFGGLGNATMTAGSQAITVFGGAGNNTIQGSPLNDLIFGGGGTDSIMGEGGNDVIVGGPGHATIYAASGTPDGNNFILGDSWLLVMGDLGDVAGFITKLTTGSDSLSTFLRSQFTQAAKTLLTNPRATLPAKEATLVQQLDNLMLAGSLAPYFSDTTTTAFLATNPNPQGQVLVELDRLILARAYAGEVKPRLSGGGDVIYAASKGDVIDAGVGNSTVYAGGGNDVLIAGLGNVQEFGNGGNDLLIGAEVSSINNTPVLPANVAQLLAAANNMAGVTPAGIILHGLTGGGNDLLVGGGGSDVIFGGAGNCIIYGGNLLMTGSTAPVTPDGNNFITGGGGNDVIFTDDAAAAATSPNPTGISIKSSIWFDANGNGTRDTTETGFAGVSVTLWLSAKPPGVSGNQSLGTVVTDVNGNFEFDGLDATGYLLVFSLPSGMQFTTRSTVTVTQSANDSDANPAAGSTLGQTSVFTMALGQTLAAVSAGYTSTGPATVSISDASVTEGTSGQTPMVFTVTLSGPQSAPVQITYQTLDGNASDPLLNATVADGDYVPVIPFQTLTFNPGETSKPITILINGSTTYATNATFQVKILSAQLVTSGAPVNLIFNSLPATGTIINPNPIPTISIHSFDPGDSPALAVGDFFNPFALIQQLNAHSASDIVSQFLWSQFSSVTQATLATGTPAQQQAALLTGLNQILQEDNLASGHNPLADALLAAGIHLSPETSYLLSQNLQSQEVTQPDGQLVQQNKDLIKLNRLLLDDAYPTQLGGIVGTEGMPATFLVTLSNPSKHSITVNWQTDLALTTQGALQNAAALPFPNQYANYDAATGMLTFQPGVTSLVITVQTLRNYIDQANTHFYVDLSNPAYARIDQGHGFGLIRNLDPPVTVSFVPVASSGNVFQTDVTAYANTPRDFVFQVQLLSSDGQAIAVSGQQITVTYSTSPGTAIEDINSSTGVADYVGLSGTLVFAPFEMSKTIIVRVNPRALSLTDAPINFFVNLLSATYATIAANPQGYPANSLSPLESNHVVVVIHSPTVNPSVGPWSVAFSSINYDVTEPTDTASQSIATITLVRTAGSDQAVVVFYTTNGTATAGVDYEATRQIVRFAPDELTKTVTITIDNDGLADGDETVHLYLRNPTGGPVGAQRDTATLTIHDPNPPAVYVQAPVLVAGPPNIYGMPEGNSGTVYYNFTVNLRGAVAGPGGVTVYYQTVDLTGLAGTDYATASGWVTILQGQSFANISIGVIGNTLAQLNRTFGVLISQPARATLAPQDRFAMATIFDDDKSAIHGTVFYDANNNTIQDQKEMFFDANNNGIQDTNEMSVGLAGVQVDVTSQSGGISITQTVTTDATGLFTALVEFGAVNIKVHADTVTSPYGLTGQGAAYTTTTNNETQTVDFEGLSGLPTFAAIGYHVNSGSVSVDTTNSKDLGTGHTQTTVFGGSGNDQITLGSGNNHVVGGSWMTATDANAPINQGSYDATVLAAADNTPGANGPLWSIDVTALSAQGSITGTIKDGSGNLLTGQVVTLFDSGGDPVNSVVTGANGAYTFAGLFFSANAPGNYVVRFTPPVGDTLVLSGTANLQVNGGDKTSLIAVTSSTAIEVDATYQPSNTVANTNASGFGFGAPGYRVSEDIQGGMLAITIARSDASLDQPVVLQTRDGSALQGVNYGRVSVLLDFAVGVTTEIVYLPIINTKAIGFAGTPLTLSVALRAPTGRLLDQATVYIGGDGFGHLTDDDIIHGGSGASIIIGDSGNITAAATYAFAANSWTNPTGVTYVGGPGKDIIFAGSGPTFVNGQLDDDTIYGGGDHQTLLGDLGNDVIYAGLGAEMIDGGPGVNTIASNQDVATIALAPTSPTAPNSGTLVFRDSAAALLGTAVFLNIQKAELFGGLNNNEFDLTGWEDPAVVVGGGGSDILNAQNDTDLILRDATPQEIVLFDSLYGVNQEGSLGLQNGNSYAFAGIANVWLTGGAAPSTLNASGYSSAVTFHGSLGGSMMIGGSGPDTFAFDAGATQGADIISGSGTLYTLDFSSTQSVSITLDLTSPIAQAISNKLTLTLQAYIPNVIDGQGDNTINASSGVHQIILLPYIGPQTVAVTGNGAGTTLNFSAFNAPITVNLSNTAAQPVGGGSGLSLVLPGANVNNIIGGAGGGTLTGNAANDTFTITGGPNIITGNASSANNTVNASANADFILTSNSLTVGGVISSLTNIQTVNLTGGANANLFTVNGFSGTVNLTGGGGSDSVTVRTYVSGTIIVTNSAITYSGTTIYLNSIATVIVTDTTAGVVFDASAWTAGNLTLTGGASSSLIANPTAPSLTITLTNSILTYGSVIINLNPIASVSITDTAGGITFDVTGWTAGNVTLTGAGAGNTVEAQAAAGGTVTLTNTALTFNASTVVTLSSIQNVVLNGSSSGNSFNVRGWTAGQVTLNGSGNNNTVAAETSGTITLTNTEIIFSPNNAFITLNSIQNAVLYGTSSGVTFNVRGWTTGPVTLNGTGTNNTVQAEANTSGQFTLTTGSITFSATPLVITLTSVQNAELYGSASGNVFDLMSWSGGILTFNGNAGINKFTINPITSSQLVNVYINGGAVGGGNTNKVDISSYPLGVIIGSSGMQTLQANVLVLYLTGIQTVDQGNNMPSHVITSPGSNVPVVGSGPSTRNSGASPGTVPTTASAAWALAEAQSGAGARANWLASFQTLNLAGGARADSSSTAWFSGSFLQDDSVKNARPYGSGSDALSNRVDEIAEGLSGWSNWKSLNGATGLHFEGDRIDILASGLSHTNSNQVPAGPSRALDMSANLKEASHRQPEFPVREKHA